MSSDLSAQAQDELRRSAAEASKIVIAPVDVDRYLNPSPDTPFPLEYAFHLLGDVHGKTVLDLGCGSGETLIPLVHRGATVTGIDISPDLVAIAKRRIHDAQLSAEARACSAYETGLPDRSVDVIFCMSLVHHLNIAMVRNEMHRILKPGGYVVVKEPIRFSKGYGRLRSLLPAHDDISEYEHPLTEEEFDELRKGFVAEEKRFFRLPFVPLIWRTLHFGRRAAFVVSNWTLTHFPATCHYATTVAVRLRLPAEA
ncbi:MAG TPA: methyltransferase domain-containing protein [Terriglobales bacterium]|jgi:SAM-dependent methyltransferase|nr:methyltransferase domain-containing protein [Terriglobales bacterium]